MPARVVEVGFLFIGALFITYLVLSASIITAPSYGEAKGLLETQAKYSLLAIENFKSTNASFSNKSIMDLIHLYYLTNRTEYLNQAEDDISYYFPRCLSVEWRVYTTDGMLDVGSFNFSSTKSRSSAQTTVLDRAELVVVAGAG